MVDSANLLHIYIINQHIRYSATGSHASFNTQVKRIGFTPGNGVTLLFIRVTLAQSHGDCRCFTNTVIHTNNVSPAGSLHTSTDSD